MELDDAGVLASVPVLSLSAAPSLPSDCLERSTGGCGNPKRLHAGNRSNSKTKARILVIA